MPKKLLAKRAGPSSPTAILYCLAAFVWLVGCGGEESTSPPPQGQGQDALPNESVDVGRDEPAIRLAGTVWQDVSWPEDRRGRGPMLLAVSDQTGSTIRGTVEWPARDQRNPFEGEIEGNGLSFTEACPDADGNGGSRTRLHTATIAGDEMSGQWKMENRAGSGSPLAGFYGGDGPREDWFELRRLPADAAKPPLCESAWSGRCEPPDDDASRGGRPGTTEEYGMGFGGMLPATGPTTQQAALFDSSVILTLTAKPADRVEGTLDWPKLAQRVSVHGSVFSGGRFVSLLASSEGEPDSPAVGGILDDLSLRCTLRLSESDQAGWEMKGDLEGLTGYGSDQGLGTLTLQAVPQGSHAAELAGTVWTGNLESPSPDTPDGLVAPTRFGRSYGGSDEYGGDYGREYDGYGGAYEEAYTTQYRGRIILSIDEESDGRIEATAAWPDLGSKTRLQGNLLADGMTVSLEEYADPPAREGQSPRLLARYTFKIQGEGMSGERVAIGVSASKPLRVKLDRIEPETIVLAGTIWKGTCRPAAGGRPTGAAPSEVGMILVIDDRSGDQIRGTVEWPGRVDTSPFTGFVCADGATICFVEEYKPDGSALPHPTAPMTYGEPGYGEQYDFEDEIYGGYGSRQLGYDMAQYGEPLDGQPAQLISYSAEITAKETMEGSCRATAAAFSLQLLSETPAPPELANTVWKGRLDVAGAGRPAGQGSPYDGMYSPFGVDGAYGEEEYYDDEMMYDEDYEYGLDTPAFGSGSPYGNDAGQLRAAIPQRDSMVLGIRWIADGRLEGIVQFPEVGHQEDVAGRIFSDGRTIGFYERATGCSYALEISRDSGGLVGPCNLGPGIGGTCSLQRVPDDAQRVDLAGTTWTGTLKQNEGKVETDVILEIARDRTWQIEASLRWKPPSSSRSRSRRSKPRDRTFPVTGFVVADGSGLCFRVNNSAPWIAEISDDRLAGSVSGGQAPFILIRRVSTQSRPVIDPWDGVTVVRSPEDLDRVLELPDENKVVWIRLRREQLNGLQLSRLKQSAAQGMIVWTDTDLAGAFGLAYLVSPAAPDTEATGRIAGLEHTVLRNVPRGEISYGLSAGALVAEFSGAQLPKGMVPLIGKSSGGAITAAAAVIPYGRGRLVLLPSRLAGKDLDAAVRMRQNTTAGSTEEEIIAGRLLANLRSHSLAAAAARIEPRKRR